MEQSYYLSEMQRLLELGYEWESNVKYVKALYKAIENNEDQLKKSLIRIPFHKPILDDAGIIKHEVPQLLADNHRLIDEYNQELAEVKQQRDNITARWHSLAVKMTLANDKQANEYGRQLMKLYPTDR